MAPARQSGKPRIFVSHGKWDTVLPIERCSRPIVRHLKKAGYNVQYHEFNGFHTVLSTITQTAMNWFTQPK